jgi:Porin subfamily
MKMVKSLLLGSAAGLVAVAGAQAADLPVKAKPVQYVKICTLYGDGFYYIPGSDTCIRFSGYIRADYGFNVTGARTVHYTGAAGAQDRGVNQYSTRHRGSFSVDTRTQTAYGTLRTFQTYHLQNENGSESTNVARAFIQWGGFTFGRTVSFTDHEGTLGDSGMRSLFQTQNESSTGANGINQIAYTWQLGNGVTLNVGADESRVKSLSNLSVAGAATVGSNPTTTRAGNHHPDPWISLRVSQAWGRASIAVVGVHNEGLYYTSGLGVPGYTPGAACTAQSATTFCNYPDDKWGFAVISGAEIKLDFLSPGSRLGVYANYGVGASAFAGGNNLNSPGLYGSGNQVAFGWLTDGVYVNGGSIELTTSWTVGGGFEYFWTRNFSSTIYGNYTQIEYNDTVVNGRFFCGGTAAAPLAAQNIIVNAATTCDPSFNFWTIGTHHDWFPLPGLRFAVDVMYTGIDSGMSGSAVTLTTKQGFRPTGGYVAKDLGITAVIFRAQRTWGAD